MAFSKKRVEDRKTWLRDFQAGTFLDHTLGDISYHDFIHKELILFSRAGKNNQPPYSIGFLPARLQACTLYLATSLLYALSLCTCP
jgi:DNA topoisomerase-2